METILLVDDEAEIRMVVRKMLESRGYVVLDAGDPHEALRLATGQQVDLLVTDVVMPRMRGTELARRLQALVPSVKVLLISAYEVADVATSGYPFLAKPFTPDVLDEKVRQVLRAQPSPFARKPPPRPAR